MTELPIEREGFVIISLIVIIAILFANISILSKLGLLWFKTSENFDCFTVGALIGGALYSVLRLMFL